MPRPSIGLKALNSTSSITSDKIEDDLDTKKTPVEITLCCYA